jgi:glycosyltransferase involved in cell wall biosynthesis
MKALVSIITPTYNAESHIAEAIKSVQAQTYTHWEMLITDDSSVDATYQRVEGYAKEDNRIKLFKLNQNSGPALARNHSIKKAKGHFIAFLDADDIWFPEKLTIQIEAMQKNEVSVCYSSYLHIDEKGESLNTSINAIPNLSYNKLLKNNYIGNLTGIYNVVNLGKIYNPELKKRQDWCLWLEALKRSKQPALGIQKPLAKYRIRQNSISRKKLQLPKYNFQVYYKYLKFNRLKSSFYLMIFLIEYFIVRPKYIHKY